LALINILNTTHTYTTTMVYPVAVLLGSKLSTSLKLTLDDAQWRVRQKHKKVSHQLHVGHNKQICHFIEPH